MKDYYTIVFRIEDQEKFKEFLKSLNIFEKMKDGEAVNGAVPVGVASYNVMAANIENEDYTEYLLSCIENGVGKYEHWDVYKWREKGNPTFYNEEDHVE